MRSAFRTTSIQAWQHIQATASLGTMQRQVAELLTHAVAPRTAQEIQSRPECPPGGWKRLSELERMGVVVRCPARRCKITGRMADTWAIAAEGRGTLTRR